MAVAKTGTYYNTATITTVKSFILQAHVLHAKCVGCQTNHYVGTNRRQNRLCEPLL
jgi:hypothetical protein